MPKRYWSIISNFTFIPYLLALQNCVQNMRKTKIPSVLSCIRHFTILSYLGPKYHIGTWTTVTIRFLKCQRFNLDWHCFYDILEWQTRQKNLKLTDYNLWSQTSVVFHFNIVEISHPCVSNNIENISVNKIIQVNFRLLDSSMQIDPSPVPCCY